VTSNFAFVQATLPALFADCSRAESYLVSDPRAACVYSRRVAEELVGHQDDIFDELTANGVMDPSRLYESPYIDHGHLDVIFPQEVGMIVKILRDVKAHALSADVA
jgi:hypothetical protein